MRIVVFIFSFVLLTTSLLFVATLFPQQLFAQSKPLFESRIDYLVAGGVPKSLTAGDFNGDAIVDLAVSGGAILTVFLGNGNGMFSKKGEVPGEIRGGVISADFNQDGKLDLAVTSRDSVFIFLSNGDGTFRVSIGQPAEPVGGGRPTGIVSGDFDRDKKLDLALYAGNGISVFLGNGDGTLRSPKSFALPSTDNNKTIAQGDFNQDGYLDLVTAGVGGSYLLMGKGDGSFLARGSGSARVDDVKVADLNRDGKLDLAFVTYGMSNSLYISYGDGKGGFSSGFGVEGATYPFSLGIADLDADGYPDIIVPDFGGSEIWVHLNKGERSFPSKRYVAPNLADGVISADFNRDGKLDLAVGSRAERGPGGFFGIYLGKGDGTLHQPYDPTRYYGLAIGHPNTIVAQDFNGDSNLDIAVGQYSLSTFLLLMGDGKGAFQPSPYPQMYQPDLDYYRAISGDFNGDGKIDLAVADGYLSIFLGNGNGTFQPGVRYSDMEAISIAASDFNKDGKIDLATATTSIFVLQGKGDGTFQKVSSFASLGFGTYQNRYLNYITTSDFNRDGQVDLAATVYTRDYHGVAIFMGKGDFTFQQQMDYRVTGYPACIGTGDFNEDGIADIATADAGQNHVSILLGDGNGTFQPSVQYQPGLVPLYLAVGDLNKDRHLDLAVANNYSNNVSILLGKGNGTFEEGPSYGGVNLPISISIGDFDKDGDTDLGVIGAYQLNILVSSLADIGSRRSIIGLRPDTLKFGNVAVGSTIRRPLTLYNLGNDALRILSSIGTQKVFTDSPSPPLTIAPGDSQIITVSFAPSGSDDYVGRFAILCNDPGNRAVSIPVTGVGIPLTLSIDLDPTEGNQKQNMARGVRVGKKIPVWFYNEGATLIRGLTIQIGYDHQKIAYVPNSFYITRQFEPLQKFANLQKGYMEVGARDGGLARVSGILGGLEFEILPDFEKETNLEIPRVIWDYAGVRQDIQTDLQIIFTSDGGTPSPDFNGNGEIDFDDFFLFAAAFGKKAMGENTKFDLDGDGEVGFNDFFSFAAAFGTKVPK